MVLVDLTVLITFTLILSDDAANAADQAYTAVFIKRGVYSSVIAAWRITGSVYETRITNIYS